MLTRELLFSFGLFIVGDIILFLLVALDFGLFDLLLIV